ncbi:MAG: hypothetical protein GTO02_01765 [Candidatus Dadabacteria bacterium]|nr:hypothetical protein [Candidatus Dadabacteria bacterium]
MTESKLEKFKKLLDKNPNNPLAHFSIANECFKLKLFNETIIHIDNYLKLKEDEGAVYRMLAECYLELDMEKEAIEAYNKGIEAALKHGHEGMAEEFEESISLIG